MNKHEGCEKGGFIVSSLKHGLEFLLFCFIQDLVFPYIFYTTISHTYFIIVTLDNGYNRSKLLTQLT